MKHHYGFLFVFCVIECLSAVSVTKQPRSHELLKDLRLKAIKDVILSALQLPEGYNLTGGAQPSKQEIKVALQQMGEPIEEEEDEPVTNQRRALGNQMMADSSTPKSRRRRSSGRAIVTTRYTFPAVTTANSNAICTGSDRRTCFDMTDIEAHDIENATLHFKVHRPAGLSRDEPFEFNAFAYRYLDKEGTQMNTDPDSKSNHNAHGDWFVTNVTELVMRWARVPDKNFGLFLKAQRPDGEANLIDQTVSTENVGNRRIFLEISVRHHVEGGDNERAQNRRDKAECSLGSDRNDSCCRYPFNVRFDSFGWDWIVAPKSYQAFYCSGACDSLNMQDQAHTNVVSQKISIGGMTDAKLSGPCCSPKDLKSLPVVYIDPEGSLY